MLQDTRMSEDREGPGARFLLSKVQYVLTIVFCCLIVFLIQAFCKRRGNLMVSALVSGSSGPGWSPEARFSKAPETFQTLKAIFS